ncbi:MAG: hypothetical protein AMK69_26845 [Nitrospira bacterium SG8_3]|nr:MAG: hypothetical protein AMK69_26845 [Nitrospira bacterium SG8_3]
MEVSSSLLVAIMFVTILGMGIANVLVGLSSLVDRQTEMKPYGIHTGWIVLLLLIYFNQFWNLLDIFTIEEWRFRDFIFAVSGPVILFFATSVILPQVTNANAGDLKTHYFKISRQFFQLMALLQVWAIGVDVFLMGGLSLLNVFHVVLLIFFAVLASTKEERFHKTGLGVAWVMFLAASIVQGFEIV